MKRKISKRYKKLLELNKDKKANVIEDAIKMIKIYLCIINLK